MKNNKLIIMNKNNNNNVLFVGIMNKIKLCAKVLSVGI